MRKRKSTLIIDHLEVAFKELLPEMSFILDKSLTFEQIAKKTAEHGARMRKRAKELESQPV